MANILPTRWTSQPRYRVPLDPKWVVRGLNLALLPQGSNLIDCSQRNVQGSGGVRTAVTCTQGNAVSRTSGAYAFRGLSNNVSTFSLIAVVKITTIANENVFSLSRTTSTDFAVQFGVLSSQINLICGNTSIVAASTSSGLTNNRTHVIGLTHRASGGGETIFYIDGRQLNTVSGTDAFVADSSGTLLVKHDGTTHPLVGGLSLHLDFNRVLNPEEMKALTRNPWQVFMPQQDVYFVETSTDGSTDLVIADGQHDHTTDGIALTLSTTLAVNDGSHAHTTDGVVLTSQTAITVAEASHAHAADNLTLSTGSALVVNDASHAHTSDGITFTLNSSLAVNDSTHGHLADNATLSLDLSLSVADASHNHLADSLTLTSSTALVIADAIHAHAVDSVLISTGSYLTVSDATHANVADNVVLGITGLVSLVISEALHSHAVDNVILTSRLSIVIADALHDHFGDNLALTSELALIVADCVHANIADNLVISFDDGGHSQYPLAGINQGRPISTLQQYPLSGVIQTRPLG